MWMWMWVRTAQNGERTRHTGAGRWEQRLNLICQPRGSSGSLYPFHHFHLQRPLACHEPSVPAAARSTTYQGME